MSRGYVEQLCDCLELPLSYESDLIHWYILNTVCLEATIMLNSYALQWLHVFSVVLIVSAIVLTKILVT